MNKTESRNSVLENPMSEVSYLMGTFAILLMILIFIGAGFYLAVSNYA